MMTLTDLLAADTVPIHLHVGMGRCREIGVLTVGLDDGEEQIGRAMAAALRAAADQLDGGVTEIRAKGAMG